MRGSGEEMGGGGAGMWWLGAVEWLLEAGVEVCGLAVCARGGVG